MKTLIATVAALFLAGVASANVTVTGDGKVTYVPDIAHVHLSVTSEGQTAAQAWATNSEAMKKLLKALTDLRIEDRDVKTTSLNVSPKYVTPKDKPPQLVGYVVTQQLMVTVRQLNELGKTLDHLVCNGADRLTSISFASSNPQSLLDQARARAVADARRRAEIYVEGAGATVGKLLAITEGQALAPRPFMYEMAADGRSAPPIPVGEQELSVQVTITWAIKSN